MVKAELFLTGKQSLAQQVFRYVLARKKNVILNSLVIRETIF